MPSHQLGRGGSWSGVVANQACRITRAADGSIRGEGALGPFVEQNGFVFAWHGEGEPSFVLPALPEQGWSAAKFHRIDAQTHPQEVYENSIDHAHFPIIHKYADIEVRQPMVLHAHSMRVGYRISRALPGSQRRLTSEFEVQLHGLGVAHNHIEVPLLGMRTRMLALATPTTPGHVTLWLRVSVRFDRPGVLGAFTRALTPLALAATAQGIVHDFRQDLSIWAHKRYLERPVLVAGDGPIGRFRRWARQFYGPVPAGAVS
ncbi:MAG: hypothetical protein AAF799_44380 [Myxococcota bacterium]